MPREKKTPEQQLAELKRKQDQIKARIQKTNAKLQGEARKKDTRRKIIAGALALEHAAIDQAFGDTLNRLLFRHVERSDDRALFNLPPRETQTDDAPDKP